MNGAVAAVVLAGGASRRMGREKALLRLPDGRSALTAVLEAARTVASPVLLAVDTEEHAARLCATLAAPWPRVLLDADPGAGPLVALAGAMRVVHTPLLLALAVDTPLVRSTLLRALVMAMPDGEADIALPVVDGVPQVLLAAYATRLVEHIDLLLRQGRRDLRALLEDPAVHVRRLDAAVLRAADADLRSFVSANTPEEWRRVLALAGAGGPVEQEGQMVVDRTGATGEADHVA